ncbi:P-loop containing nucleoside triphosphate hydrolase protein [Melanogaster broomeanus]|nr:P-loop containing nucleoside triphosphate hydrolase protein [Melanogaster broomeanus]
MPTVKLVVIGASGVGKTSLRAQYISGRFSTGYRATIGADFISKTLSHPSITNEVVTLQIWDTAGQERFSSLSTAFFRGADAALLMFDVNQPETLTSLTKWWTEFRERAPLSDEDVEDYCCVVVGNKMDLVNSNTPGSTSAISEAEALRFLDELVPCSPPLVEEMAITVEEAALEDATSPYLEGDIDLSASILRSRSIDINHHHHLKSYSKSRSRSSTRFHSGTMTSTHTGLTSYHTPSSSLFDVYASARSSPVPQSVSSRPPSPIRLPRRMTSSLSSASSSSAPTITPSLFTRDQAPAMTPPTLTLPSPASETTTLPPLPERGPRLFFTSAKTGEGVREVFEYITRRVVTRWEYEAAIDSRTLHVQDINSSGTETIRLGLETGESKCRPSGSCCGQ